MAAPSSVHDIRSAIPRVIVGSRVRLPIAALGVMVGVGVALPLARQIGVAGTVAVAAIPLVAPVLHPSRGKGE